MTKDHGIKTPVVDAGRRAGVERALADVILSGMFKVPAHAEYLRKKAARFRDLAAGFQGAISGELLALAGDMEAHAAELERRPEDQRGAIAHRLPLASRVGPTRDPSDERRLIFRVLRHWTEMAIAQRYPRKDNIDPWLVGDDWPNCMLLSLHPDRDCSAFYVVGANLLPPGACLDGATLPECPGDTVLSDMLKHIGGCVEHGTPVIVDGSTTHLGESVRYRGILLPLSEEGESVDGIFGAANFTKSTP